MKTNKLIFTITFLTIATSVIGQTSFHLRANGGVGYSRWTNILYTEIYGGTPPEIESTGTGLNYSFTFYPLIKINNVKFGPVIGFKKFDIGKLDSETETQFDKVTQYGISVEYIFKSKSIYLAPNIELGLFNPNSKPMAPESKNKIYTVAGLVISKPIGRFEIFAKPNLSYFTMNYSTGGTKVWDNRITSFNLDLGIEFKI